MRNSPLCLRAYFRRGHGRVDGLRLEDYRVKHKRELHDPKENLRHVPFDVVPPSTAEVVGLPSYCQGDILFRHQKHPFYCSSSTKNTHFYCFSSTKNTHFAALVVRKTPFLLL